MPSIAKTIGPILRIALLLVAVLLVTGSAESTAQTVPNGMPLPAPGLETMRAAPEPTAYPVEGYPARGYTAQAFTAPSPPTANRLPTSYNSGQVVSAEYQPGGPVTVAPVFYQEPVQAAPDATTPIPLAPRGSGKTPSSLQRPGMPNQAQRKPPGNLSSIITVAGSLAVVLGIFFLVAWGFRRAAPPGLTLLPTEAFEVLGRAPLASRQQVHLLRCGNKLLLVSVTPAGAETLTEVTDPIEVDRLAGVCRQSQSTSATAAFRQVFQQLAQPQSAPSEFPSPRHAPVGSQAESLADLPGQAAYGDPRLTSGGLRTNNG